MWLPYCLCLRNQFYKPSSCWSISCYLISVFIVLMYESTCMNLHRLTAYVYTAVCIYFKYEISAAIIRTKPRNYKCVTANVVIIVHQVVVFVDDTWPRWQLPTVDRVHNNKHNEVTRTCPSYSSVNTSTQLSEACLCLCYNTHCDHFCDPSVVVWCILGYIYNRSCTLYSVCMIHVWCIQISRRVSVWPGGILS